MLTKGAPQNLAEPILRLSDASLNYLSFPSYVQT